MYGCGATQMLFIIRSLTLLTITFWTKKSKRSNVTKLFNLLNIFSSAVFPICGDLPKGISIYDVRTPHWRGEGVLSGRVDEVREARKGVCVKLRTWGGDQKI